MFLSSLKFATKEPVSDVIVELVFFVIEQVKKRRLFRDEKHSVCICLPGIEERLSALLPKMSLLIGVFSCR